MRMYRVTQAKSQLSTTWPFYEISRQGGTKTGLSFYTTCRPSSKQEIGQFEGHYSCFISTRTFCPDRTRCRLPEKRRSNFWEISR